MDLSNYVRVGIYDLPEPTRTSAPTNNLLAQEASSVTYNWDTNTLFVVGDGGTAIVQVSLTGQLIDTMTLAQNASHPQGVEFYDTEGITYVGGGQFVITEERWRQVDLFTYSAGTTLTRGGAQTVDLGTDIGNVGLEGVTYDMQTGGFILVKEKDAEGVFQTSIDFANHTASNGSATTTDSVNLFNPALIGTSDLSDVYALSSNDSFVGTSEAGNLLFLSQESGRIVETDRAGNVLSHLDLVAPSTPTGIDLAAMTVEGITMGPDGKIYLVSEQGGGDFDHPQLWVYAPTSVTNSAPTGIALTSPTASILENTDTSARVKVAGVNVTDDGVGTNSFSVSGADAKYFEADSSGLYIKAGTVLDYEAKATYSVTVNVDDTTVGATPDASVDYALNVTNIVNEGGASGGVVISEVAPWSSGNSPANVAADWFELTNVSSVDIGLSGWKMDDNSYAAGSAVAMSGVASLAPGESAIFLETTSADVVNAFRALWNIPANVQVGMYSGAGVGLSSSGDAVNVFNSAGVLQASVTFGASPASAPFATFDNTAGLNSTSTSSHVTISTLSATGVHGAYAINPATGQEIGSPGSEGGVAAPVNHAPTALGLSSEITSLAENTSTASHVKVADVVITDDGLGTNTLSVSGADAKYFEVDSSGLYIKAGTALDFETQSHYAVTVNVDDTTVGATPDASVGFTLDLTDVVEGSVRITEVAPWSSGNSPVAADWFEVTNTGGAALDLTGWKMDDNSNSFGSAVALNGVTSLAAGESAIFIETTSATTVQTFLNTWFGGSAPAGLQIGTYSGSGVGLSTGGDAVNLFNASGALQANVTFGASPSSPFGTFDNTAGLNNAAITTLSSAGVNGAHAAAGDSAEIGSPGFDAAINHAPTALGLTGATTSLAENTSTVSHVKVADVVVTDDSLGTNTLSVSGADAKYFEVDSTGLYIKAGTVLDFETKPTYDVTVNVDDATVGATPDASTKYSLSLTDVPEITVRVTEVAPWSSGNSPVAADWFEVTNTGAITADLTGWKMDDNSNSFANAVELNGVTSLAPGESAIFIETASGTTAQTFLNTWFGANAPVGLQIGTYSGSGVGLSTGGDAVNVFNAAGALQAKVTFGSSPSSAPFGTFDNAAGADNVNLTTFSTPGVHAAFNAANDGSEVGSPGEVVHTNHAPVGVDDTGAGLAEDSVVSSTGNVLPNDRDSDLPRGAGDVLSVAAARAGAELAGGAFTAVSGDTLVHGAHGDLTIHADGSYIYTLNNGSAAVQDLDSGQSLSDLFSYQVTDGHGAIDVAQLSFNIAGLDDYHKETGTDGADTLTGTAGADRLDGLAGADKLNGGDGDDLIIGGLGADKMDGGDGIDTASYANADSAVIADIATHKGSYGEATGDTLLNFENLTGSNYDDALFGNILNNIINGGAGNDHLEGVLGDDTLIGGAGDDVLIGGRGLDALTGGDGDDTFVFLRGDTGKTDALADTITDFVSGHDRIDLSGMDASTRTIDVMEHFSFIGTSDFHRTPGELRYEVVGSDTLVSGDWDGNGKVDFVIHLTGVTSLTAADFIL